MYRINGKARMVSLGVYGDIYLAVANRKHAAIALLGDITNRGDHSRLR